MRVTVLHQRHIPLSQFSLLLPVSNSLHYPGLSVPPSIMPSILALTRPPADKTELENLIKRKLADIPQNHLPALSLADIIQKPAKSIHSSNIPRDIQLAFLLVNRAHIDRASSMAIKMIPSNPSPSHVRYSSTASIPPTSSSAITILRAGISRSSSLYSHSLTKLRQTRRISHPPLSAS
jgi:hypothetical protein